MLFYRAKEEKFAEYLNQDGLVSRITTYSDTASGLRTGAGSRLIYVCHSLCAGKNKTEVQDLFKHRRDRLKSRVETVGSGKVCESFGPGRQKSLKGIVIMCVCMCV